MMKQSPCVRCGFIHSALGVEIAAGVLVRIVRKESQRIRGWGGAYGFIQRFWDAHVGRDFSVVVIRDTSRGEIWTADQRALGSVRRETLSGAIGPQVLLLCSRMDREAAPELVRQQAPEHERVPAQSNFFAYTAQASAPGSARRK